MTKAIVIGGGIAGCSTAYALARRGIAVTLIERHSALAQEGSGNPIAMLYPKFSAKPDAASTLGLHGFRFTLDLLNQWPSNQTLFNACGLIQLAFDAREQARQQALSQQDSLAFLQRLDAYSVSEKAGIELKTGGIYLPQSGWTRPAALCKALSSSALVTTHISTNALKIQKNINQWQVFDDKNTAFEADIVVMCNANDIKQFKSCASMRITPVRGQVNFFAQNDHSQKISTIICSDHYLSPVVDGLHSIGTTYAPNDTNPYLSDVDTRENLSALCDISPDIYSHLDKNSVSGRVAWRSHTLDYMPLAGQLLDEQAIRAKPPRHNTDLADLPWLEGLYVNAGHGSKGMITAPICGELIASLITNSNCPVESTLASKLNPSRFLLRELGLKQLANSLYK
ncbi:MAG: FAD-dependent 5-carboxymethylaminomethyl-2-thiouridine(34) oxidoreductase MnmC [Methylotenera sp.]